MKELLLASMVLVQAPVVPPTETPMRAGPGPMMLCGTFDQLATIISGSGERQMAQAEQKGPRGDMPYRLYVDPKDGSWTAVVVVSKEIACMVGAGTGFKPAPAQGQDS